MSLSLSYDHKQGSKDEDDGPSDGYSAGAKVSVEELLAKDSEDDAAYTGEQKEIQRECQELRAVESWINQEGWDLAAEGRAVSPKIGRVIDLRLPWEQVQTILRPDNVLRTAGDLSAGDVH